MTNKTEFSAQARQECAEALSRVLADTFVLYLKTHASHWNVEGAQFLALHKLFEEQYRNLWTALDEIAERIRALGQHAPGTTESLCNLAEIKESDQVPPAAEMLRELVGDNEMAARTIRIALSTAQTAGDEATAGLLGDRLAYHEKQLWMMRSTVVS